MRCAETTVRDMWNKIFEYIEGEVASLRSKGVIWIGGARRSTDAVPLLLQITTKHNPVESLVLEFDPQTKEIQFDSPIATPGVPRRSFFEINRDGLVALKKHVVGQEPPKEPMTVAQFSKYVLSKYA
jgi:hypothetical protein